MAKRKFYVVWKGRKPGVYDTWPQCAAQVKGFPGAKYRGFNTLAEARRAFAEGPAPTQHVAQERLPQMEEYSAKPPRRAAGGGAGTKGPIVPSIAVDAACSGNPGELEYRGVNTETEEVLFHMGPFENGTNNIGEFLAIVGALQLCATESWPFPIYTDSRTALAWVKAKKARTNLRRDRHNSRLFGLIANAESWLSTHSYKNPVLKWETEAWGENPADFGRK